MAKQEKSQIVKDFVMAIYEFGIVISQGTTLNQAAKHIHRQFEKSRGKQDKWGVIPESMNVPSIDTIKRLLKTSGIVERDFVKERITWIKK